MDGNTADNTAPPLCDIVDRHVMRVLHQLVYRHPTCKPHGPGEQAAGMGT